MCSCHVVNLLLFFLGAGASGSGAILLPLWGWRSFPGDGVGAAVFFWCLSKAVLVCFVSQLQAHTVLHGSGCSHFWGQVAGVVGWLEVRFARAGGVGTSQQLYMLACWGASMHTLGASCCWGFARSLVL
jgi:hypothetical protein